MSKYKSFLTLGHKEKVISNREVHKELKKAGFKKSNYYRIIKSVQFAINDEKH